VADQIDFDEHTAAQLEVVYRTRDIKRRRALAQEALASQPGDEVLDVGCGPGFYVVDILDVVGENGVVTGVDASAAMLAIAGRKAGDRPNVRLLEGEATKLPLGDASVDRAISVQVFEYLSDVDAALAELMRVVRPGGRVVIWDIDWSTLSWHSSDTERMRRMVGAWDRHLPPARRLHGRPPRRPSVHRRDDGPRGVRRLHACTHPPIPRQPRRH
jgi:arsenite methyltransferase